jgi:hypothetical protein
MTIESIQEREKLAEDIEAFLAQEPERAFYPVDLVTEFEKLGKKEPVILSAIWRLIDEHRINLNKQLKVAAFPETN